MIQKIVSSCFCIHTDSSSVFLIQILCCKMNSYLSWGFSIIFSANLPTISKLYKREKQKITIIIIIIFQLIFKCFPCAGKLKRYTKYDSLHLSLIKQIRKHTQEVKKKKGYHVVPDTSNQPCRHELSRVVKSCSHDSSQCSRCNLNERLHSPVSRDACV